MCSNFNISFFEECGHKTSNYVGRNLRFCEIGHFCMKEVIAAASVQHSAEIQANSRTEDPLKQILENRQV